MLWHNAIETWPVIKKDGANPLLATLSGDVRTLLMGDELREGSSHREI